MGWLCIFIPRRLRGSKEVAQDYVKTGRNVVAMCNLDMTGYASRKRGGIFTDYTDSALTAFLRKLWTTYVASKTHSQFKG